MNTAIQIQPLFPLALGRVQLYPEPLDTAMMLQAVLNLRGVDSSNPDPACAWTGDLHEAWQVHRLPSFSWLRRQVEIHSLAYIKALGFDLQKVGLWIQRSWPVVSEPGQVVGRHHHPTAHLSVVYYINGDGSGSSGSLRLYPPSQPNELVPGLAVGHDGPIHTAHPLNTPWVDLAPLAGLLVLFPSSTDHAVTANEQEEDFRISVSFDLYLSASLSPVAGAHPPEYLPPHPGHWDQVIPPDTLLLN